MKQYFNSFKKPILAILAICLFVSCADTWDDHYKIDTSVVPKQTLLGRLESDPDFSNFVEVLKTTKIFNGKKITDINYSELLDADQFFTVWAPENSAISADLWDQYTKENKTRQENYDVEQMFLKNHIARFSHPVGASTNKSISMLSEKVYRMNLTTIAGVPIDVQSFNLAAMNGVIHKISGRIEYNMNLYERLTTDLNFNLLGKYFAKYMEEELDEDKSVSAGIVDGEKVYIDSVIIERNILMDKYGFINSEDSNYVIVVPDSMAWRNALNEVLPYYDYGYIEGKDSFQQFWANNVLLTDMFYNMNLQKSPIDSVTSMLYDERYARSYSKIYHTYYRPYDVGGLFHGAEEINCSNGIIYKTDTWRFDPYHTYFLPIAREAEREASRIVNETLCTAFSVTINSPKISENRILRIKGVNTTARWDVKFGIPGTLAGKYKISAVILPNNYTGEVDIAKPNKFVATITYRDKDGSLLVSQCPDDRGRPTKFVNDENKIDTVMLDTITFPTCNFAQDTPNVTVELKIDMLSSETRKYSNIMYLDCIYLEPIKE
ncbi:MAG TPA: hypothetical protein VFC94_00880 [Bacteroidaceae bacterium]|nr:hypothetical protein [Bacteroidaceae bacterium]